MPHPLGKRVFDFDSWNEAERKDWIEQLLLQACEEAEMQSINNQITWAITHKGSVLEKRGFGWFSVTCSDGNRRSVEELTNDP